MSTVYRRAMRGETSCLNDIRRRSILRLASPEMPAVEAQAWAERLTLGGTKQKLRALEVWVAQSDGAVAGWGAIRSDCLEGLYVAPNLPVRASGPDCSPGWSG